MLDIRRFALRHIARVGPQWMPFLDVATPEVPLSRLLRLSLFQVTVGMALVLLAGTLNRVMIVELNVPATIVAAMLALPLLFAPFRALIGFRSDYFHSAIGWRRVPYIFRGTMLQFGGFAIMPFALLVLSGYGEAVDAPRWIGLSAAALAFLLVGAGLHMVQTVGLALATDLVREEDHPKVVGLMYVMLLFGMIGSALFFGLLLENYTPGRLIQLVQGAAVATVVLNGLAMWKQESRNRARGQAAPPQRPPFGQAVAGLTARTGMTRLLVLIAIGTAGFAMGDVLMEPYGAQVLQMSVAETTRLTAVLAFGTLLGFVGASRWLSQGQAPGAMALLGAAVGAPAFVAVIATSATGSVGLFVAATLAAGFGAGLFSHATLTLAIRLAPRGQTGLALGVWGAVQTTAAGTAIAAGGVVRDAMLASGAAGNDAAMPYLIVFGAEAVLLAVAVALAIPLRRMARVRASRDRPGDAAPMEGAPCATSSTVR